MIISIIVAKAKNNVIGKDNKLIWRLSSDLKHFKRQTTGHYLIMGRKTYESMGKPLPNRTSIVITRKSEYPIPEGHYIVHGLDEALELAKSKNLEKVFIAGGAEIYEQALPYTHEMIITEVDCAPSGDAFFPKVDWSDWKKVSEEFHPKDEKNEYDSTFLTFKRIKSSPKV
ncbi:dihydrofolate reductase [Echinicola jeungdonensis]|uniref:dihydrofolate reductase n=1 Tax=Echinicola jeungdonensis TaxID=709343 RepID=UPI0025B51162|nr:dihydrofolate reductase [Echinicola jeungdonensis]MDN3670206.1 dihydrofolate reductase [Echinicola jeungdonensis]